MYLLHVLYTCDRYFYACIGTLCQGGKVPIPRRSFKTTSEGAAGRHFHLGKGYKFPPKKKQKNKRFYYAICANESRPRRGYLCTHGNYCTSIGDSALPSAAKKKLSFLEKEEEEAAAAAAPTLQSLLSQRESLVGVPMADQQDENGSFVVEVGPKKRENLRHCTFSHSSHGTGRPVVL